MSCLSGSKSIETLSLSLRPLGLRATHRPHLKGSLRISSGPRPSWWNVDLLLISLYPRKMSKRNTWFIYHGQYGARGIDLPWHKEMELERSMVEADALGINPLEDTSTRLNYKYTNKWWCGNQLRRSPWDQSVGGWPNHPYEKDCIISTCPS